MKADMADRQFTGDVNMMASSAVNWVDTGDVLTLFDSRSGGYIALNATASAIWRLVAQGADSAAIADALSARFAVDLAEAGAAVDEFVADMLARGLIEPAR